MQNTYIDPNNTIRGLFPMEWISVKDRLPEKFTAVIVYRTRKGESPIVEQGTLELNGWWKVFGTRTKSVTHWMPMPEPPREADNG